MLSAFPLVQTKRCSLQPSINLWINSFSQTFNLSDVVIAFRAAGKAYLPIAQRIVSALKQSSSDDDEKEAVDAIVTLLQQGRISRGTLRLFVLIALITNCFSPEGYH